MTPPTPATPVTTITTRVPRVFSIWGTVCYGVAAAYSIISVLLMGIIRYTPPWYFIMASFLYVFISTGIICYGRIESNRDAKVFMHLIRKRSEENKRCLN